jgi:hypothetical protein
MSRSEFDMEEDMRVKNLLTRTPVGMNMQRRDFLLFGSLTAAAAGLLGPDALAQWSIGAPGRRQAPPGLHRYVFLVFANPIPGKEAEFNDWYTNTHMGDLVQLQGWMGAQRFRIVNDVSPRPSAAGYEHGYLIVWDLEDTEANAALSRMTAAIAGGKSRRGAAFDYTPGAAAGGTFEAVGPRIMRSDGRGPTLPDPSDNKTPRPNRYVLMDFANASPGKEAQFEEDTNQRIQAVLTLPGWMAAQRFRMADTPGRAPSRKPRYLTIWETEGASAQASNDVLFQAQKNGLVKTNSAADESAAEVTYWEPITPHITKDDFIR